ncbi:MAG: hypothetical protein DLM59_02770 [Pseudonocardiales bacterium]|nr:MAG: hypothetical protein DLM59_02770 [Pseudonocardiales bacterium]
MYGLSDEEMAEVMAAAVELVELPAADQRQAIRELLDLVYARCANKIDADVAAGAASSPLSDRTWQQLRMLERHIAEEEPRE